MTGYLAAQLARVAGLRVIAVADESKHGDKLRAVGIGELRCASTTSGKSADRQLQSTSLIEATRKPQSGQFVGSRAIL